MGADDGRRVTITAIAREAGVSVPTVSRVLNGRSDVAPGTRERVEELLHQHGYRRRTSRSVRRAGLVDLVFNDLDSPWAVEIIRGVEDVGHGAGVGTVVSACTAAHRRPAVAAESAHPGHRRRHLRDLPPEPAVHAQLRRLNMPVVVVDPAGVPAMDVPTIGATNWAGGLAATEHLLSLGHRRIGFVAGPTHCCAAAPGSTVTGPGWRRPGCRWTTS